MEFIGRVNSRKVFYVQVRNNPEWKPALPKRDWVAFTIANKEDEELVRSSVKVCMDKNVSYTCSTGALAGITEDYFDEEIAWRGVDYEMRTKQKYDYEKSPMTTAHKNFGEGFWFASTLANDDNFEIDKVVCLDFTKSKVKKHLIDLVEKINNGWLPSNGDSEVALYDYK
ncbi:hypothetical protein [Roseivirga misakiensis]|uniref:Uncharacterized protein n=1 Tax=Roseivirga misakiensis TaxID=1563681 RepID=A0A1E5SZ02_9BACT|nr:hypothetical protein [Roseivirga misakiensis]OEK04359.1 hypothetical protein BFP71_12820 [Roseivirga misakiensis]